MRSVPAIILILVLCAPAWPAAAQTTEFWMKRWRDRQTEAAVTVARVRMEEAARYELDGAFGIRRMEIDSELVLDRSGRPAERTILVVRMGDRTMAPEELTHRRRFEAPVRRDLLQAADNLLTPLLLDPVLKPTGEPETDRVDGRDLLRVLTVSDRPDYPIEFVTWWFDRTDSRLIRTRAVVRGEERGALIVDVRYRRIEGIDLPVERRMEGSFAVRRRTRSYTVLVDNRSRYREHVLDGL